MASNFSSSSPEAAGPGSRKMSKIVKHLETNLYEEQLNDLGIFLPYRKKYLENA